MTQAEEELHLLLPNTEPQCQALFQTEGGWRLEWKRFLPSPNRPGGKAFEDMNGQHLYICRWSIDKR